MAAFVVDASVAVKWVVDEEDSEAAVRLSRHELWAPGFLLVEAANVLWVKERRGEITAEEVRERFELLRSTPIVWVPEAELLESAVKLSLRFDYPIYDCLYLALGSRQGIPVVTADRRLVKVVRRQEKESELVVSLHEIEDHTD